MLIQLIYDNPACISAGTNEGDVLIMTFYGEIILILTLILYQKAVQKIRIQITFDIVLIKNFLVLLKFLSMIFHQDHQEWQ